MRDRFGADLHDLRLQHDPAGPELRRAATAAGGRQARAGAAAGPGGGAADGGGAALPGQGDQPWTLKSF